MPSPWLEPPGELREKEDLMAGSFAWVPTKAYIEQSNIWRFMQKHHIKDYKELIERSTEEIEWFWDAVVKELQIEFFTPYQKVLDISQGIAWAKWFIGGKINIAHNCVDKHARSRPDKIALIWEGEDGSVRRITYRELYHETNRLANALKSMDIEKGDCVGVFMPMVPETVVAMMACAKLGAIFTPIFSGFGAQAVAARLNDCEAKLLLTAESFSRKGVRIEMGQIARDAARLCPTVKEVMSLPQPNPPAPFPKGKGEFPSPFRGGARGEVVPTDSEDPFMIIYTSGTTGRPKGAVHVHGGFLVKIAQEVAHQVDLQDRDILYWVTDMGWIMGPWEIVGGLALGGTVFLYEGAPDYPSADRLWAMVERHKISILGISPTLIRALMKFGEEPIQKHNLSSLRILASTGEPWNPDPWLWFFENVGERRCPIINLSGGTEVGACFLSPLPITPLKPCALGGPALGMEIDVFDSEGKPLRGGVGELVCKKPWPGMTRGIWKDPERYIQTYWSRWENVWVHGDWASIDIENEDGLWYLHGRSDDTIKIAGKRLGPAEIESILVGHPAVAESAAIGVPHELKGESIWCYAVLKPGREPSDTLRKELRERVIEALGKSFAPESIKFVKELPKTRNAKILRRAIRAKALGHEPGDLSNLENPQALEEIARAG
jgi:acetyl-CoA synthetase